MKKFFVFMAVFALAFVSIQDVKASEKDIPCLKSTDGNNYKTKLKSYSPSSAEKTEPNFQDGLFWEMTDWDKADTTSSCGTWDDKTFGFTFPCEGSFEFHRDMGGQYLLGFYWRQIPNQAPSIGTPTASPSPVEVNQDVTISFVPQNIDKASYTTTPDGPSGSFNRDTAGNFTATLNFSSAGDKTVTIRGSNPCGGEAETPIAITVNNTPPPTVNCDSLTASFTASPENGNKPLTVSFDASDSQKAESYSWDFGDNQSDTGKTQSHTYANAGSYTVTLTVKDATGKCPKTAQKTITVTDDPCANKHDPYIVGEITVNPHPEINKINVSFGYNDDGNDIVEILVKDSLDGELTCVPDSKHNCSISFFSGYGTHTFTITMKDKLYSSSGGKCGLYTSSITRTFSAPSTPSCTGGQYWDSTTQSCVCPRGQTWSEAGQMCWTPM